MTATVPGFAVVATVPIFCPSTDAFQCERSFVAARFHTKQEALDYIDDDCENDEVTYKVEMKPYEEGEETYEVPSYSLLELHNHDRAVMRDLYEGELW